MTTGLTRDRSHRYFWNGGLGMPGVSSLLRIQDALSGGDGLTRWAAGVAVDRYAALVAEEGNGLRYADDDDIAYELRRTEAINATKEAANVGSSVHAVFESMLRGEPVREQRAEPFFYGIAGFLAKYRPEPIELEAMCANLTSRYGGTFDAALRMDGAIWLLDLKTGKVKDSHRLQLAAYAECEFIGKPDDPTQYPMPKATKYAVLQLRTDGYELFPMTIGKGDREHVHYLASVHERLSAWLVPENREQEAAA